MSYKLNLKIYVNLRKLLYINKLRHILVDFVCTSISSIWAFYCSLMTLKDITSNLVSLQIMHSANLDRCRYLHKVLAVWYIHLGLCEDYTCLLIRNISAKGNRVQIFNTDFNTFVWSPLNLNSEAVSFVFSVTLTAHAESLVFCDLDLWCREFGLLWPWPLLLGV